ncbi:hypothetical protein FM103_12390 [Corynebacterium xerosis]|nr:hypothetical protein FM103_12390 [Corynebacterium xerosis]
MPLLRGTSARTRPGSGGHGHSPHASHEGRARAQTSTRLPA